MYKMFLSLKLQYCDNKIMWWCAVEEFVVYVLYAACISRSYVIWKDVNQAVPEHQ